MKGIFISYRRQDAAGYAGRLYDRLASHFGAERVFMDVEGIEPGLDFVDAIERAVASCEVLIVIIGPGWLATDKAGKHRLDDPKDFVRIETAAALARKIRVVPVLVDNAVMPRAEELPADLAPLVRRQAVELSHKYWDGTSAELIRTLERVLDGDKAAGGGKAPAASTPRPPPAAAAPPVVNVPNARRFWVIGAVLALVAAAVGLYLTQPWQEPAVPQAEQATVAPPPSEKNAPTAAKPPAPQVEKAAPPASEKIAEPAAEKVAPLPEEKRSAPAAEKAAPQPTEKPAPPSVAKTEAPAPARAPERAAVPAKSAAPEPSQAAKPPSVQPPARSPATTSAAPSARSAETASAPAPSDEKAAVATPAQPGERPSAPVAAAPATTPPVTAPVVPSSALPATLPQVGDTWEYRWRSKWPTIEPRTYAHRVTAVSTREVAETMSVVARPDSVAVRQALTPDTRFVEWRGPGFYLLEFNPFLEAFGGLQNPAAMSKLPAMPAEDPFHADWYSRARVRDSESVTVPAGTFKSLKVEIDSTRRPTESAGMQGREPIRVLLTIWYAPEVKRTVKMVRIVLTQEGMHLDEDTYELVRYRVQ